MNRIVHTDRLVDKYYVQHPDFGGIFHMKCRGEVEDP